MVVRVFTKEKQEQCLVKKLEQQLLKNHCNKSEELQNLDDNLNEVVTLSKELHKEIVYNTWYKLYMLQNYDITQEMFKGATLRWQSINTYLTYIRAIYNNKLEHYNTNLPKGLLQYIQGLMDSGTEPYPLPAGNKPKSVTIQQLIDSNVLSNYQVKYIFDSVGVTDDEVDTSSAWTQSFHEHNIGKSYCKDYYPHIHTGPQTTLATDPIKINTNKFGHKYKSNFKPLLRI